MSEINKYNKVPDHIKILDKISSSKGELRSFVTSYVSFGAKICVIVITC